jgi:Uma2 family endonuclease
MADGEALLLGKRVAEPTPHRFTYNEVLQWQSLGLISPESRFELLDGELIDTPSEGGLHKAYKLELGRFFTRALSDEFRCAIDSTLVLEPGDAPEPDLHIFRCGRPAIDVRGADVLLLIEIADSFLTHDTVRKVDKYARHGVREYWVVDVNGRETRVYGPPAAGAYPLFRAVPFNEVLRPSADLGVELRISDLPDLQFGV